MIKYRLIHGIPDLKQTGSIYFDDDHKCTVREAPSIFLRVYFQESAVDDVVLIAINVYMKGIP